MGKHLTIGICAHVDAGKTTLSESLLYLCGSIKNLGRVDKRDTFLDNFDIERERGITVFSKQAQFESEENGKLNTYTLLDTPGHADLSPELERTLQVLDLAILVISGPEGVNSRDRLLWKTLDHYRIPVFIFVNKMDRVPDFDMEELKAKILSDIKDKLSGSADPLDDDFAENVALSDEKLLNAYMDGKEITDNDIQNAIAKRRVFPVIYGSALKLEGIEELIHALNHYGPVGNYNKTGPLKARVFKISKADNGERLTWVKITSGSLKAREVLEFKNEDDVIKEKVTGIRIYNGEIFKNIERVEAGDVCTITGLSCTYVGQGIGEEKEAGDWLMQAHLCYRLILPAGADPFDTYRKLGEIRDIEPMLQIEYNEEKKEITVRLTGQIQKEIIQKLIKDRLGINVSFGERTIIYKETIAFKTLGIGHFEPLRHYSEVHLLMEPLPPGSGLVFESRCSTDDLALNWQRLILNHLEERKHKGVLTGSELTDVKITVVAGKAHVKHTEGGDFRQSTYRAVRQGLMHAVNVLLEPYYDFVINVPMTALGKVLTDLDTMGAKVNPPEITGDEAQITGYAPLMTIGNYSEELSIYTKGEGSMSTSFRSYDRCADPVSVIEKIGYDPEFDRRNPSSSVFCIHGTGEVVPHDKVFKYAHVESIYDEDGEIKKATPKELEQMEVKRQAQARASSPEAIDAELMKIFEATYGPIKSRTGEDEGVKVYGSAVRKADLADYVYKPVKKAKGDYYLLVDGYNIVHAWDDLKGLASSDLKAARDKLLDILANYAGFSKYNVVCVFDAYKVSGGQERVYKYNDVDVVYTKEAETADLYIEKTAHKLSKNNTVVVATSDAVEQLIIYSSGARRMSARDLLEEIKYTDKMIHEHIGE